MVKTVWEFSLLVCDPSADYKPLCAFVCASVALLSVNVFPHVVAVKLTQNRDK